MDKIELLNYSQSLFVELIHRFAYVLHDNDHGQEIPIDEILETVNIPAISAIFVLNKVLNIMSADNDKVLKEKEYSEEELYKYVEDILFEFNLYYQNFLKEEKSNEVH